VSPRQLRVLKWHLTFLGLVTGFAARVLAADVQLPGTSSEYKWKVDVNAFDEVRWEFNNLLVEGDTFWFQDTPQTWGYDSDHRTIVGGGFYTLIPEATDEFLEQLLQALHGRMIIYLDVALVPRHGRGVFGALDA
jgi:hypothetical protein